MRNYWNRTYLDWELSISFEWELPVRVSIETALKINNDYSVIWYKARSVIKKNKITEETFKAIKTAFRLRKDWKLNDELLFELKSFKWENYLNDFLKSLEWEVIDISYNEKYQRQLERAQERAFEELKRNAFTNKNTLNEIEKIADNFKFYLNKIKPTKIKKWKKRITIAFSDTHLWMKWHKQIIERLNYLQAYAINCPETIIDFFFLWDLVETFVQEWMHWDQIWKMDISDVVELWKEAMNILMNFILWIAKTWKQINFNIIWWNHDRWEQQHKLFDPKLISLFFHKAVWNSFLWFKNVSYTFYENVINKLKIENINYIFCHWDDWILKTSEQSILLEYWDLSCYNVFMHWHLHFSKTYEVWDKMLFVWIWAFANRSDYAKNLLKSSNPSFTVIRENEFKLVDIEVKFIN